jgi:hypothetical protein
MLTITKALAEQLLRYGIILLLMPMLVNAEESKSPIPIAQELLQLKLQLADQDRKISQLQREIQLLQIEKDRLSYSIELLKQQLQIMSWTLNQRTQNIPPTTPNPLATDVEPLALTHLFAPISKEMLLLTYSRPIMEDNTIATHHP